MNKLSDYHSSSSLIGGVGGGVGCVVEMFVDF